MVLAVGDWDDSLGRAVVVPQIGQLLLQTEAIVPVGGAGEYLGQPAPQRPEVGVGQARPAADKHQGLG